MRPHFPALARPLLAVVALAAVLALGACGGDGASDSTTADGDGIETTITSTGPGGAAPGATGNRGKSAGQSKAVPPCDAQLGGLLGSLDSLRVRLATGFSYEQYAGAVHEARTAYAGLDARRLPPACLLAAGTAAEKSLNRYIEAANTWGECLADAGCDGRAVEPELQRQWQVASHWLSQAHEGLERAS